jgi:lantibiotic modifying enzyme
MPAIKNDKGELSMSFLRILDRIDNSNIEESGLLGGHVGLSIFYYHVFRYNKKSKYKKKALFHLDEAINTFDKGRAPISYAEGISGIIWGIKYLNKLGLNIDVSETLDEETREFLINHSIYLFEADQFDFLYGGIGIALALFELDDIKVDYREKVIFESIRIAEKFTKEESEELTDLGLSHGFSSLLAFISSQIEISDSKSITKLNSLSDWLVHKADLSGKVCFPNFASEQSPYKSRLAWCYGDLGIAFTLLQVGKKINNESLINRSLEVLKKSCERISQDETNISDPFFCHGSVGAYHLYNKIFLDTNDTIFSKSSNYWLDETLKLVNCNDYQNMGLLDGLSGVGLMFLEILSEEKMNWDSSLLL